MLPTQFCQNCEILQEPCRISHSGVRVRVRVQAVTLWTIFPHAGARIPGFSRTTCLPAPAACMGELRVFFTRKCWESRMRDSQATCLVWPTSSTNEWLDVGFFDESNSLYLGMSCQKNAGFCVVTQQTVNSKSYNYSPNYSNFPEVIRDTLRIT
jgi:hypothetical protein